MRWPKRRASFPGSQRHHLRGRHRLREAVCPLGSARAMLQLALSVGVSLQIFIMGCRYTRYMQIFCFECCFCMAVLEGSCPLPDSSFVLFLFSCSVRLKCYRVKSNVFCPKVFHLARIPEVKSCACFQEESRRSGGFSESWHCLPRSPLSVMSLALLGMAEHLLANRKE